MKVDIDRFREILDTLTRNKSRTFLTGFGVFWGVFMLVGLIGGGSGLKEMLSNNFEGFATNAAIVFAQPTTKAHNGLRKGRQWNMTYKDVDRLKAQVPELDVVTPMLSRWGSNATFSDKKSGCVVKGTLPDYIRVESPQLFYGRYINDMDISQHRKVCVIGKKVYKTLFPGGGDPCGQLVRIDSIYYNVIGVDYAAGNMNINGSAEESVVVPLSLMQQTYNLGDRVDLICATAKPGTKMNELSQRMREVIARAHNVAPDDEKAVMVFNTEVLFGLLDSLFSGVNFLIWLVGIGTLLAGAIGVSNIMMVTVRERTSEIGIRRAIGAKPLDIMVQILMESVLITIVAGLSGITLGVMVLAALEYGVNMADGTDYSFLIPFGDAVGALLMLTVFGALAGMAPAYRAMSVKPIDAMHDE